MICNIIYKLVFKKKIRETGKFHKWNKVTAILADLTILGSKFVLKQIQIVI